MTARYISGVVIVSRKAAYALEQLADMQAVRTGYRGNDDELYDTFLALREAALDWGAFVERKAAETAAKATAPLKQKTYTVAQVATKLHPITEAAVRLAIREGRLDATKNDGRWQITATAIETYDLTRRHR